MYFPMFSCLGTRGSCGVKFMLFGRRGQPRIRSCKVSFWSDRECVSHNWLWCSILGHKLQVEREDVIALLIHVNAQLVLKIQIKVNFNDISYNLEMHQVRHVY